MRAEVRALRRELRERAEQTLRAAGGVELRGPGEREPEVVLYVAESPRELVELLGTEFEPHLRSVVLDLAGALHPQFVALLGLLGYVRSNPPPALLRQALEDVRRGFPFAHGPSSGLFHLTREQGPLTVEEKRILSLAARGCVRAEIEAALGIAGGTLRHRITDLRKKLGALPGELLPATARRMGFPSSESEDAAREGGQRQHPSNT